MDYGTRIAELREKRGWKQEELAQILGITRAALSHYEKNRRKPDFDTLTILANLFGVSIDYLIGRIPHTQNDMNPEVKQFIDHLELSDKDILRRFNLMIDGRSLSEEEAKRFIAFIRMERMME
ncbi:helix-turn-helix domain-containing protein [Paenibacillus sp. P96]|uniref:Helix-turn-helix domain-containing protein n=1 Tax=Paenibacillus zeirhizosphaerae TaxID=2987519 RepID=A0ABT9FW49_9BACL|nr:helix-turn-helix domain-containing protein [Paenibacillus sp. P96]MDP4098942.1 helix-turn-helix domain-containing protein [Paenibacillus sp. P96]